MRPRRLRAPALVVALVLFALTGCGPLVDPEAAQERAVVPASRVSAEHSIGQTFVASRAGLTAVEVPIVAYPAGDGDDAGDLVFELRAGPESAASLATARVPVAALRHNQPYRFAFAPRPDSLGRQYYLLVKSTTAGPARATLWSSGGDAYPAGAGYRDGGATGGDLAFRAYYDYDLPSLVADLARALGRAGWVLPVALIVLLAPGLAIQRWLLPTDSLDAAERVGLWLGLGLAASALLWLLATTLGLALGPGATAGLAVLFVVAGLAAPRPLVRRRRGREPAHSPEAEPDGGAARPPWPERLLSPSVGAFAVAGGALVLRYVHAKDLALPMWGDSVHHTLIARLMAEAGRLPVDYGPFVPAQPFTYHFGYHAQVVFVHWLTGLDVATAVLFEGQLISALLVFPTYLLASRLAGDRRAGLVAGLVVGLISVLPAYSVTWGRYPQLAGLAVLPAAAYLFARTVEGARSWRAGLAATTIASAGLVLTHPRVALLFGCYALAYLLIGPGDGAAPARGSAGALPRRALERIGGRWLRAGAAAALAVLACLPWLARLATSRPVEFMLSPGAAPEFRFPFGILTTGFDRYLLAGALAAVGLSLLRRRRAGALVATWVAFCLVAANTRLLGLPVSLLLSNDALAIALFLPIAVLDGVLVAGALGAVRYAKWRVARLAGVPLLVVAGLAGGQNLVGIVNPVCVLATAADVAAIRWVASHTPPDAAFLINSFRWQADIYMGSDGGYWLPALADRRTSLPPLVYDHGSPADIARIRRLAEATQPGNLDLARLGPTLREAGLTHVFVGARGGALDADLLRRTPGFRLVYTNGRAWVFEVEEAA